MTAGGIMVFKSNNKSNDDFVAGAASLIAVKIREVLKVKSICSISLAGGNTPGPVYRALTDETVCGPLPLEKIELYFGDERFVFKEDKDSNYFMAKSFFGDALDRFSAVHTMDTEGFDEVESLKKYDSLLDEPIDIMILGLGEDAHVASIFPGSILFEQNDFKKAAVITGPKPPPKRMTITPAVISNSQNVFVIAKGEGKQDALKNIFTEELNSKKYPGQLALSGTWILDEKAALKLFIDNIKGR